MPRGAPPPPGPRDRASSWAPAAEEVGLAFGDVELRALADRVLTLGRALRAATCTSTTWVPVGGRATQRPFPPAGPPPDQTLQPGIPRPRRRCEARPAKTAVTARRDHGAFVPGSYPVWVPTSADACSSTPNLAQSDEESRWSGQSGPDRTLDVRPPTRDRHARPSGGLPSTWTAHRDMSVWSGRRLHPRFVAAVEPGCPARSLAPAAESPRSAAAGPPYRVYIRGI